MTFREIGYKAMAINLSDIAAMGARPDGALVQIIFPENRDVRSFLKNILSLYEGFHEACRTWHFPVIGGNLSKGPCFIIDITLIGRTEKNARALLRKGARAGDGLWVTGIPGCSAAGLFALKKWGGRSNAPEKFRPFIDKHIRPVPRIEAGLMLAGNPCVHAMIDVSDGIAQECRTLAYENNMGIVLEAPMRGIARPVMELRGPSLPDRLSWFLYGGEDYELLFAASPGFAPSPLLTKGNVSMTRIGVFSSSVKGVQLKKNNGTIGQVEGSGWDHLKKTLQRKHR